DPVPGGAYARAPDVSPEVGRVVRGFGLPFRWSPNLQAYPPRRCGGTGERPPRALPSPTTSYNDRPSMGEHLSPGEVPAGAGAPAPAARPSPSLLELWWSWLAIGAFSLGGGAATLLQMRRVWVDRHGWVSGPFFDRAFQMSQVVPGINILAVAIQLGR